MHREIGVESDTFTKVTWVLRPDCLGMIPTVAAETYRVWREEVARKDRRPETRDESRNTSFLNMV